MSAACRPLAIGILHLSLAANDRKTEVRTGLDVDSFAYYVAAAVPCRHDDAGRHDDAQIRVALVALDRKAEAIRRILLEQRACQLDKEWYTIAEAAAATRFKPYTLRQCCSVGRIPAEWTSKHHRTGERRILREAIEQIRNHGLPPGR